MHRPAAAAGTTTPHAQAARLPSNKNFQKFCRIIDRGKMATDPRFEGGGCYLIVARMSAATSGSSHLLWFPHIAALMRATCWGMGPTRSRG
jgi:hypothetical protein